MKAITIKQKTVTGLVFLAATAWGQVQPATLLKEISAADVSKLSGYGFTQLAIPGPDFRTAATVSVRSAGNAATKGDTQAERSSNFGTSAVYAAVGKVVPAGVMPAETMEPNSPIGFKESYDSAQAWATMSGAGMPFVSTVAFGQASASGSAAWIAKLWAPQSGHTYVQFTLPRVKVAGQREDEGPSPWTSRFRADLLLNGQPVWSTEAIRHNLLSSQPSANNNCTAISEKGRFLTTFGPSIGVPAVDTSSSNVKTVTVSLGSLPAGQAVELSLVVRADVEVAKKCCVKMKDGKLESFCTGAAAKLGWDDNNTPVKFFNGPAI